MMINQLPENIEINENNIIIENSIYNSILESKIDEIENIKQYLNDLINKKIMDKIVRFQSEHRISFILLLNIISIILAQLLKINSFFVIIGIATPLMALAFQYFKQKDLVKEKINILQEIENYLKSEQEIAKNKEYALSHNKIHQLENFIKNDIEIVKNYKLSQLSTLFAIQKKYEEGCKKNLLVLQNLHYLNDNQKDKYLKDLCKTMNSFEDINTLIANDFINILVVPESDDLNKTSIEQSIKSELESNIKPISLNKKDYEFNNSTYNNNNNIITPNELNAFFKNNNTRYNTNGNTLNDIHYPINNSGLNSIYIDDEDILPPRAQEELEKGHQFSKKFPK